MEDLLLFLNATFFKQLIERGSLNIFTISIFYYFSYLNNKTFC